MDVTSFVGLCVCVFCGGAGATAGKELVDYIADYLQTIRQRRVFPDVQPGYIRRLCPDQAPQAGEDWDAIFADVERVVMPGVSLTTNPKKKQTKKNNPNLLLLGFT